MDNKKPIDWRNLLERAGWTGLQAVASMAVVELAGIQLWWAAPLALILSGAKTLAHDRLSSGNGNG